jgi:hypothetical protein
MTYGTVLLIMVGAVLVVVFFLRVVPVLRRGRVVVLDRPKPCSMHEAQHALDRLIRAGFDAEIVESAGNAVNLFSDPAKVHGILPDKRYVIQVPRKQAKAASQL